MRAAKRTVNEAFDPFRSFAPPESGQSTPALKGRGQAAVRLLPASKCGANLGR